MNHGKMLKPGDVVLAKLQFTDTFEVKTRPALVLFEESDNIVVAGITSNTAMKGITITKKEGAIKELLFSISKEKKKAVFDELVKRLKILSE